MPKRKAGAQRRGQAATPRGVVTAAIGASDSGARDHRGKFLHQQKPRHKNADDQQNKQHDGGHADHVEQLLRLLVRGGLLPVRLLKLLVRPSAGGCGLPSLVPLPLQRRDC
jgi:hypothetical protein